MSLALSLRGFAPGECEEILHEADIQYRSFKAPQHCEKPLRVNWYRIVIIISSYPIVLVVVIDIFKNAPLCLCYEIMTLAGLPMLTLVSICLNSISISV